MLINFPIFGDVRGVRGACKSGEVMAEMVSELLSRGNDSRAYSVALTYAKSPNASPQAVRIMVKDLLSRGNDSRASELAEALAGNREALGMSCAEIPASEARFELGAAALSTFENISGASEDGTGAAVYFTGDVAALAHGWSLGAGAELSVSRNTAFENISFTREGETDAGFRRMDINRYGLAVYPALKFQKKRFELEARLKIGGERVDRGTVRAFNEDVEFIDETLVTVGTDLNLKLNRLLGPVGLVVGAGLTWNQNAFLNTYDTYAQAHAGVNWSF